MLAGKTRSVAWLVSNCKAPSLRLQYVEELSKYIDVDIFGKCGNKQCPDNMHCYDYLSKHYKFYLAFENSLCLDYITEKAWRALEKGLVPVVLGMGPYLGTLPPNSFIEVKSFTSPKALAKYLKLLHSNDSLYMEYFKWHENYELGSNGDSGPCGLCEYFKKHKGFRYYDSFTGWYTKCMSPLDYFTGVADMIIKDKKANTAYAALMQI